MAERKIRAGYYRRYDGKVVYVVSLATDADTGEESVIWTAYPFADVPKYYTSSKKSFCAFVEVNGERRAKYKRLLNMKISGEAIERLEEEGFRDRFVNEKIGNWMNLMTPEIISNLLPTTHTQKISVSTTTSTGTNIASA